MFSKAANYHPRQVDGALNQLGNNSLAKPWDKHNAQKNRLFLAGYFLYIIFYLGIPNKSTTSL